MVLRAASFFFALASLGAAPHPEAGSVLILVNDAVRPEAGTGSKGASVYVGEYYAQQRGIPTSQILHLNLPMAAGGNAKPQDWDSWHTTWATLDAKIRQPVLKYLADHNLKDKINYIVPVYGIPTSTWDVTGKVEGLSIDSFLASLNATVNGQPQINQFLGNPYFARWNAGKGHFRDFKNPAGWKMYIVTRLDGPSVSVAIGLIDKAIRAEGNLKATDGTAYFDYRHVPPNSPYYSGDTTVTNANNMAKTMGFTTVLNDNGSNNDKMIHSAPKTLWAWGWYSGNASWDGYEFVDGAVGAQLTSYTATSIRGLTTGGWVPRWLNAGITATWGATREPYLTGYANGDNFFNKFWSGYNFGESAYQASPYLNHAMIFVGDPLYAPKIFQAGKLAMNDPFIASVADGGTLLAPGSLAMIAGASLSTCTAQSDGTSLPGTLCGTTVTLNEEPAPLLYVSPVQINLLVPRHLTPGQDVRITVTREDGDTSTQTLPASRFASSAGGIFVTRAEDGVLRAIVQNPGGTTNNPAAPLKLGEAGVVYAAGLGLTDVPVADLAPTPLSLVRTLASVQVFVNGQSQQTFFSGLTPGLFGLYQVNFILDPTTPVRDNDQNEIWLSVDGTPTAKARISLTQSL